MSLLNVKVGKTWLPPAQLKRCGFPLLIAGIGALAAALVLVRVLAQGPLMDGDSILYVEAANGLLEGLGFLNITGGFLVLQPPLFPVLLTAADLVCLTPLQAAGWVQAAAFGLTTVSSNS